MWAQFGPENTIECDFTYGVDVKLADLDDDGDLEIFSFATYDKNITWYDNLGGEFGPENLVVSDEYNLREAEILDLDGDGDLDIIAQYWTPGKVEWFENIGDGTFTDATLIISSEEYIHRFAVEDLDGDGDYDLLFSDSYDNNLKLLENLGGGIFGAPIVIYSDVNLVGYIEPSDIDGDGDYDLAFSNRSDHQLIYCENLGGLIFGDEVIIHETVDITLIQFSDIDLDGLEDIITVEFETDEIQWYKSLGDFEYEDPISLPLGEVGELKKFRLLDVDSDGDDDVIGAHVEYVTWFENNEGEFEDPIVIGETGHIGNVVGGDIDNDGDNDVVAISWEFGKTSWFLNYLFHDYQLRGDLFIDSNENGIKDPFEKPINSLKVQSAPSSVYSFSFENGKYIMNFDPEIVETYLISPEILNYWKITSDSINYTANIDEYFTYIDSADFGFFVDSLVDSLVVDITGGFSRCNRLNNYWVKLRNVGTTIPSGVIRMKLDEEVVYEASTLEPDSIIGQNIYWSFDSLYYFEDLSFAVQVEMPDFTEMGEIHSSFLEVQVDSIPDILYGDTLNQRLVCAYDPNDKKSFPEGLDSLGYIAPDTPFLEYTIRFQNTGTDTAFNVVIIDQLDSNLDWTSFTPRANSHSVETSVNYDGEITFEFEDILLPDSNVNEIASQGFIKYRININDEVEIGTSIYNTAEIYFDENPAIVTNTEINTIACLDTASINPIGDNDTLCIGSVIFSLEGFPIGGSFSGMGVVDNDFESDLAGLGSHMIYYNYEDDNGCSSTDSIEVMVVDCLGVNKENKNRITIYPNPFRDYTKLKFDKELAKGYAVIIHDILGEEVYRNEEVTGGQLILNKQELGTGIYLLSIKNNDHTVFTAKLIIQ